MTLKKNYYIWSNLFIYWALIAIRIKAQDNQHDRGIGVRQAIPRFALFTANPAIVSPTTNNIPQNLQVPSNKTDQPNPTEWLTWYHVHHFLKQLNHIFGGSIKSPWRWHVALVPRHIIE